MPNLAIFLLSLLWVLAHVPQAKANSENHLAIPIGQLFIWEDKEKAADLNQAMQGFREGKFEVFQKKVPAFGFSKSAIWLSFYHDNSRDSLRDLWLEVSYPILDHIEVYHVNAEGKVQQTWTSGDALTFDQRPIDTTHFVFPLKFSAKSRDQVFIRVHSAGSIEVPLQLWESGEWIRQNEMQVIAQGAFSGALAIMIVYNLFIFLSVRNLSYLYYVVFVFGYLAFQATMKGYAFQYIFPSQPHLADFIIPATIGISSLFSCLFALEFLKFRETKGWLRTILRGTAIFFTLSIVSIPFVPYRILVTLLSATATLNCILMIVAGVNRLMAGKTEARFYVAAWATYTFGGVLFGLSKLGIIPTTLLTIHAQQIGSLLEIGLISMALADRLNTLRRENLRMMDNLKEVNGELSTANTKLKDYVGHVEELVQAKTRHIRSMFDTLKVGIATISKDIQIEPEYSAHLSEILHKKDLANQNPIELLYHNSNLNQEAKSLVLSTFHSSLGEPSYQWEVNEQFLPKEWQLTIDQKTQILECEYTPILRDDVIERILIAVRDVTSLRQLEASSREQAIEREIIVQLSQVESDRFRLLVQSARAWLDTRENWLQPKDLMSIARCVQALFIHLHTLKGNARTLGLSFLSGVVHEAEHVLAKIRDANSPWDPELIREHLKLVDQELGRAERIFTKDLRRSLKLLITLKEDDARGLIDSFNEDDWRKVSSSQALVNLTSLVEKNIWKDARSYFTELLSDGARLARELGKEPPLLEIKGQTPGLSPEAQSLFYNILTHLLRNSIDHGLETAEQRLQKGKSPIGSIKIRFEKLGQRLQVSFTDDGQGLDLNKIRAIAIRRGILEENKSYRDEDIAACILEPGFSTSAEVTDISGRGVGMDAVVKELEQRGGSLHLDLQTQHQRTAVTFIMQLPMQLFHFFRGSSEASLSQAS